MASAERANGTTAWSGRKDNLRYAWWGMEEAWRCFAGEDPLGSWKGSAIRAFVQQKKALPSDSF